MKSQNISGSCIEETLNIRLLFFVYCNTTSFRNTVILLVKKFHGFSSGYSMISCKSNERQILPSILLVFHPSLFRCSVFFFTDLGKAFLCIPS